MARAATSRMRSWVSSLRLLGVRLMPTSYDGHHIELSTACQAFARGSANEGTHVEDVAYWRCAHTWQQRWERRLSSSGTIRPPAVCTAVWARVLEILSIVQPC